MRPLTDPPANVTAATFSPDGKTLVLNAGGRVEVRDAATMAVLGTLPKASGGAVFSADGRWLATGGGDGVLVWDFPARAVRHELPAKGVLAFSPNGRTLASGSDSGAIQLWDMDAGELGATLPGYGKPVLALAFSPDGRWLASGSQLRDLRDNTAAMASGDERGVVHLWDLQVRAEPTAVRAVLSGHSAPIRQTTFSRDGRRLLTTAADETVRVWEWPTGRHLATIDGPFGERTPPEKGTFRSATIKALSPDGSTLATVAAVGKPVPGKFAPGTGFLYSGSVLLWDTATGKRLRAIPLDPQPWSPSFLRFSEDGSRIALQVSRYENQKVENATRTWTVADGTQVPDAPLPPPPAWHHPPDLGVRWELRGNELVVFDKKREAEILADKLTLGVLPRHQWHADQVWDALRAGNWFAAHFHLSRALRHAPDVVATNVAFNLTIAEMGRAGKQPEMAGWYEQWAKACAEALGAEHPFTLNVRLELARVHFAQDRQERAVELAAAVVAVQKKVFGPTGVDTVHSLVVLASFYSQMNRPKDALAVYEELHAAYRQTRPVTDPQLRAAVQSLIESYYAAGKVAEVEKLLTADIPALEAAQPKADRALLFHLRNQLGVVYFNQQRFGKAVALYEMLLPEMRKELGDARQETCQAAANLATNYIRVGRPADALKLLEEFEEKNGKNKKYTFARRPIGPILFQLYEQAERYDRMEPFLRDDLRALKFQKGARSGEVGGLLARLGLCLLAQRKWAEAETELRECVTIRERLAPDDWLTFNAKSMLGEALLGQGKAKEAGPLLTAGYEGMVARLDKVPPQVRFRLWESANRLVWLAAKEGKAEDLKKWTAERAKWPPEVAPPPRDPSQQREQAPPPRGPK